ncbi:MAG: hypothetical protein A2Y23_09915 [Clostridiales bacterium GWB2_37_7]|nr:MAG: hypothetical protein A2Y23_09915 [Clostridiales bacterium GWB2_37_7]
MKEIGIVTSIKDNMAKIQIKRVSACGESCASCKGGCVPTNTYVDVKNNIKATVGQHVEIEMNTGIVFNAIFLNYVIPLFMLIIGIFIGSSLADTMKLNISKDLLAVLVGLVLMAISYLLVHKFDKRLKKTGKVNFKITRIIG